MLAAKMFAAGIRSTRAQDYKEKHKLDSKQSQSLHARAFEVMSFLSIDCELSTKPCSRFLYTGSIGSRSDSVRLIDMHH